MIMDSDIYLAASTVTGKTLNKVSADSWWYIMYGAHSELTAETSRSGAIKGEPATTQSNIRSANHTQNFNNLRKFIHAKHGRRGER